MVTAASGAPTWSINAPVVVTAGSVKPLSGQSYAVGAARTKGRRCSVPGSGRRNKQHSECRAGRQRIANGPTHC